MKFNWGGIFDIPFKNYFIASIILNLGVLAFALLVQRNFPPQIPLYYGLPRGEEQLAPSWAIIIPCAFAIFENIINVLISKLFKEDFIRKTLILSGVVVTAFAVITTLKIIFLVGSF
jgi:hypothetical protein